MASLSPSSPLPPLPRSLDRFVLSPPRHHHQSTSDDFSMPPPPLPQQRILLHRRMNFHEQKSSSSSPSFFLLRDFGSRSRKGGEGIFWNGKRFLGLDFDTPAKSKIKRRFIAFVCTKQLVEPRFSLSLSLGSESELLFTERVFSRRFAITVNRPPSPLPLAPFFGTKNK